MYKIEAVLALDLSIQFTVTQTQYDNDDQSSQEAQFGPYSYGAPMGGQTGGSMWINTSAVSWDDGPARFSFTATNSQDD